MNKNEYNLNVKRLEVEKFKYWIKLGTHFISACAWVGTIWLLFTGLAPILKGMDADQISAIAKVFETFRIGSVAGYVWGMVATTGYLIERHGKKRAIKKKAKYQSQLEAMDPNRSSSGLSEVGHSPKEWSE